MEALQVLRVGRGFIAGKAHGVLVLVPNPLITAGDIRAVTEVLVNAAPARGYLQVFPRVAGIPKLDIAEQRAWAALASGVKVFTRAGALVVTQEGFVGAAMRAAISGVMLLAPGRAPTKIFATLDEAARYLVSEEAVDPGTAARQVLDAVHALTAQHAAA